MQGNVDAFVFELFDMLNKRAKFGSAVSRGHTLLGHKSERMTTHYSAPDLARLIEAANMVSIQRPATILRVTEPKTEKGSPQNSPQAESDRSDAIGPVC